jgi:hypothetical protein
MGNIWVADCIILSSRIQLQGVFYEYSIHVILEPHKYEIVTTGILQ